MVWVLELDLVDLVLLIVVSVAIAVGLTSPDMAHNVAGRQPEGQEVVD